MVCSFAVLLTVSQALVGIAGGQLVEPDIYQPPLNYDILPSVELEDSPFTDFSPLQDDRDHKFLEGLVIEAGRHTMFPEFYLPEKGEGDRTKKFYEVLETNRPEDSSSSSEDEDAGVRNKGGSMRFYELRGQPEMEQSYINRLTRRGRSGCPEECPIYKPVCGSDGKVYSSECHLLKENCGDANVSRASSWEKCQGRHYLCPSRCLDIGDPVCASDGHVYQNVCVMRKNNCGKLLHVLPLKKCSSNTQKLMGESPCPETCPEIPKPVCGSNGVIYFNECFLKMKACRTGIVDVGMDNCVRVPKCPEKCIPLYDPVCGSDRKLYINQCRMMQQNCG